MGKIMIFVAFCVIFLLARITGTPEMTCKEAADSDKHVDYNFCVDELKGHLDNSDEDTWGLAQITVLIGASNANNIFFSIKALLAKPDTGGKTSEALEICKELYDHVVVSFLTAHEDINNRDYNAGKKELKEVMPLSRMCEDTFSNRGVHSPFTKQSQDLEKLATVGIAITNLIK